MNDSEAFSRLKGVMKSPMLQMNILAAVTGASAAILTWIFILMTGIMQNWFYGDSLVHNDVLDSDRPWLLIFIPAFGGLLAGFIIEYWSKVHLMGLKSSPAIANTGVRFGVRDQPPKNGQKWLSEDDLLDK